MCKFTKFFFSFFKGKNVKVKLIETHTQCIGKFKKVSKGEKFGRGERERKLIDKLMKVKLTFVKTFVSKEKVKVSDFDCWPLSFVQLFVF